MIRAGIHKNLAGPCLQGVSNIDKEAGKRPMGTR